MTHTCSCVSTMSAVEHSHTYVHRRLAIRGHQIWVTSRSFHDIIPTTVRSRRRRVSVDEGGSECDEGVISSTIMRPHLRKIAPGAVLRWMSARVIIHFIIMSCNADGKSGWPLPRLCDSSWLHVLMADKHIWYCLIGTYAVCDGFFVSISAWNINRKWKRKMIDIKLLGSAKLFPDALLQLELHWNYWNYFDCRHWFFYKHFFYFIIRYWLLVVFI